MPLDWGSCQILNRQKYPISSIGTLNDLHAAFSVGFEVVLTQNIQRTKSDAAADKEGDSRVCRRMSALSRPHRPIQA